jgi:2Fe-2S ferredoxin
LLEYVPEPQPNTRLTCQLIVTADLDGIVLRVPKDQR